MSAITPKGGYARLNSTLGTMRKHLLLLVCLTLPGCVGLLKTTELSYSAEADSLYTQGVRAKADLPCSNCYLKGISPSQQVWAGGEAWHYLISEETCEVSFMLVPLYRKKCQATATLYFQAEQLNKVVHRRQRSLVCGPLMPLLGGMDHANRMRGFCYE